MNLTRVDLRLRRSGRTIMCVTDEHLAVAVSRTAWLPAADVIVCSAGSPRAAADVRALLARYPGAAVVAVRDAAGRCVVGTRDGRPAVFAGGDPAALGPVAHACAVAGLRLDALDGALVEATVRPVAAGDDQRGSAASRARTDSACGAARSVKIFSDRVR